MTVSLVWWHIWKARNAVLFQEAQFDRNLVLLLVKRESMFIGINHDGLNIKLASLWNLDPIAAVEQFSSNKRRTFLSSLFKNNAIVGFSDGAWKSTSGKGGIGGNIISNSSVIFTCSGPISVNNALAAEIEACKLVWQNMGDFEKSKPVELCID